MSPVTYHLQTSIFLKNSPEILDKNCGDYAKEEEEFGQMLRR